MKKEEKKSVLRGHETLSANAEKVEEMTYSKTISDVEHEVVMKDFIRISLDIQHKEEELDAIKEGFKQVLKPMKASHTEKLGILKTRQRTVTETVYHIADFEKGMMEIYNADGELITSRRLLPEEKQMSIHSRTLRVANGE